MYKVLLVFALLFSLSSVAAEEIDINGMVTVDNPDKVVSSPFEELTGPIPGENFTSTSSPLEVEYREVWFGSSPDQVVLVPVDEYEEYMKTHKGSPEPLPEPDEGLQPSTSESRWGDDVLIDGPFTIMRNPSVALASNGDIYAACVLNDGTYDYIRIYLSTDGGANWSVWSNFSTTADRRNPCLLINDVGSTEYIYIAYDIEITGEFNVWTVRSTLGSASWTYSSIDQTSSTEDVHPVIDHDRYTPYYIYAAFQRNTGTDQGEIRAAISRDEGASWEGNYVLNNSTVGEYRDPEICYGYGGYVYVTWWLDGDATHDDAIRLMKGTSRPDSANDWTIYPLTANNDGVDDREPSVAATRSGRKIEVMYRHFTDPAWDIYEHYSTDEGANWTQRPFAYGGSDGRTRWPRLCVDHSDSTFYITWRVTYTDPERYHAASTITPGSWTGSVQVSDIGNEPSFDYPAAIAASRILSPSEMPWVVWLKYDGNYSLYFDAGGYSGMAEPDITTIPITLLPNPSNGIATLYYSLKKEGNVRITMYNLSGTLIKNLLSEDKKAGGHSLTIDNKDLPSGIYFIRISSPDGVSTAAMTVIK